MYKIRPNTKVKNSSTITRDLKDSLFELSANVATNSCNIIANTDANESTIPICVLSKFLERKNTTAKPPIAH
jgi:hypothetical protein